LSPTVLTVSTKSYADEFIAIANEIQPAGMYVCVYANYDPMFIFCARNGREIISFAIQNSHFIL